MPYCPIDTTPVAAPGGSPVPPVSMTSSADLVFGTDKTGLQPTYGTFVRTDTGASVTPTSTPPVVSALGLSSFTFDWTTAAGVPSIYWMVTCDGREQCGFIYPPA